MSNKKQTAVTWLEQKMKEFAIDLDLLNYVEQAKAMEKEQHIKTWGDGWLHGDINANYYESIAEQYYKETYETDNQ